MSADDVKSAVTVLSGGTSVPGRGWRGIITYANSTCARRCPECRRPSARMTDTPAPDALPIDLRPWAEGDLPLLTRLLGDPVETQHVGGPESPEKLKARHERYLAFGLPLGEVFAVVAGPERTAVGWVGYWESEWQGEPVWETGWHTVPGYQAQGVATQAARLMLQHARLTGRHRWMHAFPSVENAASNAVCRKLGFEFLGEVEVEYPPGTMMRSNDWTLDLLTEGSGAERV